MSDDLIYLDWAATAPLSEAASSAMAPLLVPGVSGLLQGTGNANSLYRVGRTAFRALEQAREDIAQCLQARPDEIVFTSGATESDNAALFGIVEAWLTNQERSGHHDTVPHVVVSSIEHDAVLSAVETLSRRGARVTRLAPDSSGHVTPEQLDAALTVGAATVVSIMAVNNEIGSVMDTAALASVAHRHGALFHVDATQALGKIPVSVRSWGVDALSASAHKVGGPKGTGVLYLRTRTPFVAQAVGGGQESKLRSGTQNVMGAVGFAAACKDVCAALDHQAPRLRALRDELYRRLTAYSGVSAAVVVPAGSEAFAPHVVNVLVKGIESETLVLQLDRRGICVSGGSACSSHSLDPSHVLSAIGVPRDAALGSLRVSLGNATTNEDIEKFLRAFDEVVG